MDLTHYEKLKNIIKPYLPEDVGMEQVTKESDLTQGLNINSAHLVDIVLDVEDAFDISLENQDMEAMRTVGDALKIIENKLRPPA